MMKAVSPKKISPLPGSPTRSSPDFQLIININLKAKLINNNTEAITYEYQYRIKAFAGNRPFMDANNHFQARIRHAGHSLAGLGASRATRNCANTCFHGRHKFYPRGRPGGH